MFTGRPVWNVHRSLTRLGRWGWLRLPTAVSNPLACFTLSPPPPFLKTNRAGKRTQNIFFQSIPAPCQMLRGNIKDLFFFVVFVCGSEISGIRGERGRIIVRSPLQAGGCVRELWRNSTDLKGKSQRLTLCLSSPD